jgi:hypothetical protein
MLQDSVMSFFDDFERAKLGENEMAKAQAQEMGYGFVDLERVDFVPESVALLSADLAWAYRVLPLRHDSRTRTLWIAMDHPKSPATIQILREASKLRVVPILSVASALTNALRKAYSDHLVT